MLLVDEDNVIESFSRAYLEGFTTQELLTVASRLEVDMPDEPPSRHILIGEILDAVKDEVSVGNSSDGGLNFSINYNEHKKKTSWRGTCFSRHSPPEHYNATYIRALVRDPFWVFVFWELKEALREKLELSHDFAGLRLRLFSVDAAEKTVETFGFDVGKHDSAYYLDFPDSGEKFFVELCALSYEGREDALSRTEVFERPLLFSANEIYNEKNGGLSELLILSGIKDLPVLRGEKYK